MLYIFYSDLIAVYHMSLNSFIMEKIDSSKATNIIADDKWTAKVNKIIVQYFFFNWLPIIIHHAFDVFWSTYMYSVHVTDPNSYAGHNYICHIWI